MVLFNYDINTEIIFAAELKITHANRLTTTLYFSIETQLCTSVVINSNCTPSTNLYYTSTVLCHLIELLMLSRVYSSGGRKRQGSPW